MYIAGGVESDSRRPLYSKSQKRVSSNFSQMVRYPGVSAGNLAIHAGITAENVAEKCQLPGQSKMNLYQSHLKAVLPKKRGAFDEQIVPIAVPQRKGIQ